MKGVTFSKIQHVEEIETLRGVRSFNYIFDDTLVDLLKKNFSLPDSLYLLATKNGDFVAFCSTDRDWWEENHFMIREIIVDSNFQKQGIGRVMVQKCIQHAKNKGAVGVVTETAFENTPMQKLCAKFQFKKWDNPQWKEGITYKLIF
jgi:predicted N-acetyltransferase YhbS